MKNSFKITALGLFLVLTVITTLTTSCDKDDNVKPQHTGTEQQKVFKEFWDVYDSHYPLFYRKNIDWQNIYDTYNPKITDKTTDAQLLSIFQIIMNDVLKDGHSSLSYSNSQEVGYQPEGDEIVLKMVEKNTPNKVSVETSSANNYYISYGTLKSNTNIGYINSKVFEPQNDDDSEFNKFKKQVDDALNALKDKAGIIIDVRTNGGGQGPYALYLAGRFVSTDGNIEFARKRVKTKTGSTVASLGDWLTDDFDGYKDARSEGGYIGGAGVENNSFKESGPLQYTKKVAVLTGQETASAAEYFTAAINTQSHVKTIGTKTFGIFAGSDIVTLKAGSGKWKTRLSVQDVEFKLNGTFASYEGVGLTPDEELIPTSEQVNAGDDIHIDAAVKYLQ